jgi:hypothetical protein
VDEFWRLGTTAEFSITGAEDVNVELKESACEGETSLINSKRIERRSFEVNALPLDTSLQMLSTLFLITRSVSSSFEAVLETFLRAGKSFCFKRGAPLLKGLSVSFFFAIIVSSNFQISEAGSYMTQERFINLLKLFYAAQLYTSIPNRSKR